jgi:F0F1-type ATP synthase delta subunit
MEVLERLGVHLPSLVIYVVNFLVLWVVLHFVAFKPFMRKLRERALEEKRRLAEKEEAHHLLEEAAQARDRALARARKERDALLRVGEELRDSLVKQGEDRGRGAGQKQLNAARDQILLETLQAHRALYQSFVELVLAASERALTNALDEEVRQKLIAEAAQELAGLKQDFPSLLPKGWAVVTTATPVDQEQADKISECLSHLAGKPVRILFEVDPSVLGGISVRTGDGVADATVQGRLDQLRRHLRRQDQV